VTAGRRARLATAAVRSINWCSRTLGRGSGTVIGGRAGLALDPKLLGELSDGRTVALVTGTNGKTTTTRMLAVAIADGLGPVATNSTGANMPAGHVAALVAEPDAPAAVLEVDESYLGGMLEAVHPAVVLLLNLSRDQLDRVAEVRLVAERWRRAFAGLTGGEPKAPVVVANADDPLVVWAAAAAPAVRWVGAGLVWQEDAVGCPACGGRITFGRERAWACDRCDLRRPDADVWLDGDDLVAGDGSRRTLELRVPGWFNRANAAMAVVAACLLVGDDATSVGTGCAAGAVERMAAIGSVEGRFGVVHRRGRDVRLVLAKNPAGWAAVFDLLDAVPSTGNEQPVVLSINARTADGLDPSWLWDVPFERLAGRKAVATGDRRADLAVRLTYAEVDHEVVPDPLAALDRAVELALPTVDADPATETLFIGNYTAFADVRRRLP
jgi:lipid II isoglutaminyl synthase (glutamine-hydrolysing)